MEEDKKVMFHEMELDDRILKVNDTQLKHILVIITLLLISGVLIAFLHLTLSVIVFSPCLFT